MSIFDFLSKLISPERKERRGYLQESAANIGDYCDGRISRTEYERRGVEIVSAYSDECGLGASAIDAARRRVGLEVAMPKEDRSIVDLFTTLHLRTSTGVEIPISCLGPENLRFRIEEARSVPGIEIVGVSSGGKMHTDWQAFAPEPEPDAYEVDREIYGDDDL